MDITVTLSDAHASAAAKLDPRQTVTEIVQRHVDTWLAPMVAQVVRDEQDTVRKAYATAPPNVRQAVRRELGLNGEPGAVRG